MNIETVLEGRKRYRVSRKGRIPLRQLWQVPTFVAGLLALVAVAGARPLWSSSDEQKRERYLAAARVALDEQYPDAHRAASLAERALRLAGPGSPEAAEAHYLLGSARVLLAELTPAEIAQDMWVQARESLEQAQVIGVPARDQLRHRYRLGKTYYHLNHPASQVVDYLASAIGADDSFEAYGLLARAYLRLEPPDLNQALEATKKQLGLPKSDEAALAPPRLLCGELLRKLQQPDEARKVLQRIGPGAPPDLLFQARYQLAQLLQDEGAWQEAAEHWELVKNDPRAASADLGRIYYDLGLCHRHLDQAAAAAAAWEQAISYRTEVGRAAALSLAELRLYSDQPSRAVEAFETGLQGVSRPEQYSNTLVELSEVRRRLEAGCRILLERRHFAEAMRLAEFYDLLAVRGGGPQWVGQCAEAWARSLQQARRESEARQRYVQAARAFLTVADQAGDLEKRAVALWQSALNFQSGQDHLQTIAVLERFVQLPVVPERLGQAWFVIGETQRRLQHEFAAQSAYRKCIEYPGAHAAQARYQLALAELAQGNLDEAESMLSQIVEIVGPGSEAREQSLYVLGDIHYQKKDYRLAVVRFTEGLERHPGNPNALKARMKLALACRRLAEQASQRLNNDLSSAAERDHYRKQRQEFLSLAASHFQLLDEQLAGRTQLGADEQLIAKQAAFAVGECRFDLGQFDEALKIYDVLAVRYHHQVEGLIALRAVWQCHGVKQQPDLARAALERIRITLREMPGNAFDEGTEIRSRRWWENWVLDRIKESDIRG